MKTNRKVLTTLMLPIIKLMMWMPDSIISSDRFGKLVKRICDFVNRIAPSK